MLWKIVLILGILGLLLGFAVTGISVALPFLTSGKTSWDEALIGIIPGVLVLIVSFFMALIGAIFVIKNRKKK
jgi:Na+-transporting NADH:ubiquinone oxidoreductase subunit NqrB